MTTIPQGKDLYTPPKLEAVKFEFDSPLQLYTLDIPNYKKLKANEIEKLRAYLELRSIVDPRPVVKTK